MRKTEREKEERWKEFSKEDEVKDERMGGCKEDKKTKKSDEKKG